MKDIQYKVAFVGIGGQMEKFVDVVSTHIVTVIGFLLCIGGLASVIVGAAGQFGYQTLAIGPFDVYGRVGAGTMGVLVFGLGIWLVLAKQGLLAAEKYKVEIISPREGSKVQSAPFEVSGTFKKSFEQTNYRLLLLRVYSGDDRYYPFEVNANYQKKTWIAHGVTMGNDSKTTRLAIYLVGPRGTGLFKYLKRAEESHGALQNLYRQATNKDSEHLPLLDFKTEDMRHCHTVELTR